jgi:hypothetical protein
MNTSLKCDQAHPQKKRSVIKHIVEAGMRSWRFVSVSVSTS